MPSPDLRTEVLPHLGEHRERWDRLVAAQPLPSPFLRSWWVDHIGAGDLAVVACFAGEELVGGAAFEVDRWGRGPVGVERVRSVGQGVLAPDHLDLIAAPGHHLAVAREVLAWLRRPGTRVVDLDGLAADGSLATLLAPYEVERVAAPFADLSGGAQDYLAGRPGKVRSTISRTSKRFAREGVELVTVGSDGIDDALDDLARLHDSRWADGSVFLRGWERFCNAARAGASTGDVVIHALRDADGGAVAVELDLVLGDTIAFYQAGRRTEREWRGCGSVLRARIIEAAVAAGTTEYDLLRGDEPYKAEWATDRRELVRCTLGVGLLGSAVLRGRSLQHSLARRRAASDAMGDAPDGVAVSP
jgi:CelD/BcsL family acetyltransferase involved in cellulose biosynthesis